MSEHDPAELEPQGRLGGLPYDLRRTIAARLRARAWYPDELSRPMQ
jgi:hypothetical protein